MRLREGRETVLSSRFSVLSSQLERGTTCGRAFLINPFLFSNAVVELGHPRKFGIGVGW
jgi:hypothetical protein